MESGCCESLCAEGRGVPAHQCRNLWTITLRATFSKHRVHRQTEHLKILLLPLFSFTSCFPGLVGSSKRAEISTLFMPVCVLDCAKWKPIFRTAVTLHLDPWDLGEVLRGPPGGFPLIHRQPEPRGALLYSPFPPLQNNAIGSALAAPWAGAGCRVTPLLSCGPKAQGNRGTDQENWGPP